MSLLLYSVHIATLHVHAQQFNTCALKNTFSSCPRGFGAKTHENASKNAKKMRKHDLQGRRDALYGHERHSITFRLMVSMKRANTVVNTKIWSDVRTCCTRTRCFCAHLHDLSGAQLPLSCRRLRRRVMDAYALDAFGQVTHPFDRMSPDSQGRSLFLPLPYPSYCLTFFSYRPLESGLRDY